MESKYVIRTSDRKNFKKCRRSWDWGSKIRQDLEPIRIPEPLNFGSAIHRGLEVLYDPETWNQDREVIEGLALVAFTRYLTEQRDRYLRLTGQEALQGEAKEEYDDGIVLGEGMLRNYFEWAKLHDNFKPVKTEVEFEVPIPVPNGVVLPPGFRRALETNYLEKFNPKEGEWWPVVYQGKIDLIVEDEDGFYWVDDHKTASRRYEDMLTFLELEEQVGSYAWALQHMLGVQVRGIIYNELFKGVPEAPARNKAPRLGRWFSVSKSQNTAYHLYLETVQREDPAAYQAGLYDEILNFIKHEEDKYFRRTPTLRSAYELAEIGARICLEAIDMLNDPFIYPNPTRENCKWCWFRPMCVGTNDGSDIGWMRTEFYVQRAESKDGEHDREVSADL